MSSFNLADVFESLADSFPERPALVVGSQTISFGELDRRANRLAQHWMASGVKAGDHIGLCLFNGREYVEAMLAGWKIRARTINVNYRYRAKELAYLFDNADMVGVLYEAELEEDVLAALTPTMVHNLRRGEALEAALAWADAHLRAARTLCMISPDNLASVRLAERVGYRPYRRTTYRDEPVQLFERPRGANWARTERELGAG